MGEWERNGESDEWYTPKYIFDALGVEFDLDVASPGPDHWVPVRNVFTKKDDGLKMHWGTNSVFMNPPFGGRNGQVPWIEKFLDHGNGIAIVAARTSSWWFQKYIPRAHAILFPKGKTKFVKPSGEIGKSPGSGVVLIAMGEKNVEALRSSELGFFLEIPSRKPTNG